MKRAILVLLLCILPLQASLAAVMEYCVHESADAAITHLGHHEHEENTSPETVPDPALQAALDCAHHCVPGLIAAPAQTGTRDSRENYSPHPPPDFLSAILAPGERPPLPARA